MMNEPAYKSVCCYSRDSLNPKAFKISSPFLIYKDVQRVLGGNILSV